MHFLSIFIISTVKSLWHVLAKWRRVEYSTQQTYFHVCASVLLSPVVLELPPSFPCAGRGGREKLSATSPCLVQLSLSVVSCHWCHCSTSHPKGPLRGHRPTSSSAAPSHTTPGSPPQGPCRTARLGRWYFSGHFKQ